MQVFRYYLKIARSSLPTTIIYLVIFLVITLLMTTASSPNSTNFSAKKPAVTIINHDQGILSKGLSNYLTEKTDIVSVKNTKDAQKEALFFGSTSYIVTIPAGFSDQFVAGQKPQIITQTSTDTDAKQADLLVQNYLRLAEVRRLATTNQSELVAGIARDTKEQATVALNDTTKDSSELQKTTTLFNFQAYVILSLNLLIVAGIMLSFNGNVQKRNLVSAVSFASIQRQIFAGSALVSALIWLVFLALASVLFPKTMMSQHGLLFALSSFVMSTVGLALGCLLGTIVRNRNVVSGVTNVLALGVSFISGVFIPQELLSDSVLQAARCLPVYWYVDANTAISRIDDFSFSAFLTVLSSLRVVAGFAVAIFFITFMVGRARKRRALV